MSTECRFADTIIRLFTSILTMAFLLAATAAPAAADQLRLEEPATAKTPGTRPDSTAYSPVPTETERIALPDIGSSSSNLMTPAAERRLGARFMSSVRASLPVIDDPLLSDYIQKLGARLVENSDAPNQHFTFFLIDEPVVNAFAGPGGYIGVYTGLILETQTESELASVVAHEIAHVTQHHLFRAFEKSNRMSGPAAIMMLGAVLLGATTGAGDAAMAAVAGVQAGMVQNQINFTRSNEEEADRLGIKTLANAGFDPRAMPVFFERLGHASRLYESNAPEFLRTHPVTTNRIADALGRAEQYPYTKPARDELDFYLVRATLRMRQFDSAEQAVTFFRKSLEDGRYRNEDAQRYGYVLALVRKRNYSLARKQLDILLKKEPDQVSFLIAEAILDHATGKLDTALKTLATALELYPGNYPLVMAYASVLLDAGKAARAQAVLQEQIKQMPDNAPLFKLLARAAGAAGDIAAAHQYQGEYYYLSYQMESAIQQLKIALQQKNLSFYQTARIEARLQEFKSGKEAMESDDR